MKSNGIAHYSQPDFYRFSDDSVELAKYVSKHFSFQKGMKILDLGAGCGVVGLEILARQKVSLNLVAFEVQNEYREHFERNASEISSLNHSVSFIGSSFSALSQNNDYARAFDLIVCNPPYFDEESNRPSPDAKKNRCRLIDEAGRDLLIEVIEKTLSKKGRCYILVRRHESLIKCLEVSNRLRSRVAKVLKEVLLIEVLLDID